MMNDQRMEGMAQTPAPRLAPAAVQATAVPQTFAQSARNLRGMLLSSISHSNVPLANSVVNSTGGYHTVSPVLQAMPASTFATGTIPIYSYNFVGFASPIASSPQLSQAGVTITVGGLGNQVVPSASGTSLSGGTHVLVPVTSSVGPAVAARPVQSLAPAGLPLTVGGVGSQTGRRKSRTGLPNGTHVIVPVTSSVGPAVAARPLVSLAPAGVPLSVGGVGNRTGRPTHGIGLPGGTRAGNVQNLVPGSSSGRPAAGTVPGKPLPTLVPRVPTTSTVTNRKELWTGPLSQPSQTASKLGVSATCSRAGVSGAAQRQSPQTSQTSFKISIPAASTGPAVSGARGRPSPSSQIKISIPADSTSAGVSGAHQRPSSTSQASSKLGLPAASTSAGVSGACQKPMRATSPQPEIVPVLDIAKLTAKDVPAEMYEMLNVFENYAPDHSTQESKKFPDPEIPQQLLFPPQHLGRNEVKQEKPKPCGKMIRKRKAPPDGTPQASGSEAKSQRTAGSSLGSVPMATAPSLSGSEELSDFLASLCSEVKQIDQNELYCVEQMESADSKASYLMDHSYSLGSASRTESAEQQPEHLELATGKVEDPEIERILTQPRSLDFERDVVVLTRLLDSELSSSSPSSGSWISDMATSLRSRRSSVTSSQDFERDQSQGSVSGSSSGSPLTSHEQFSDFSGLVSDKFRPVSAPGKEQSSPSQQREQTPVPRRRNTVSGGRPDVLLKSPLPEQAAGGPACFAIFRAGLPPQASIPSSGGASPLPVGPDTEHLMTLQKPQARYQEPQQASPVLSKEEMPLGRGLEMIDHGPHHSVTELPRESRTFREEVPIISKIPSHIDALSVAPIVPDTPAFMPEMGGLSMRDLTTTDITPQDKEEGVYSKLPEYHTDTSQSTKFDGMTFKDIHTINPSDGRASSPMRPHSSRRPSPNRHYRSHYSRSRYSPSSSSSRGSPYYQQPDEKRQKRRQIHIQPLPRRCTDKTLEDHFCQFGRIRSVKIINPPTMGRDPYAFVTFDNPENATKALDGGRTGQFTHSNIGYGGRREFCETEYKDLDSKQAETEDASWNGPLAQKALDFDSMLNQFKSARDRNHSTERDYDRDYKWK